MSPTATRRAHASVTITVVEYGISFIEASCPYTHCCSWPGSIPTGAAITSSITWPAVWVVSMAPASEPPQRVDAADVPLVAEYADMMQIGTRNMQNLALLQAVGSAGKPVMLKRGFNATIEEWLMAAEYIAQRGNLDIVLCERGIRTFETAYRNTLDISAVPVVHSLSHLPVMVDPSHAGGKRELVVPLARAAIAVGADAIMVDLHPEPGAALCDGPQALVDVDLKALTHAVQTMPPALGRTVVTTS